MTKVVAVLNEATGRGWSLRPEAGQPARRRLALPGLGSDPGSPHHGWPPALGEQQFDPDRGVAGGHLAVEGHQRGIAGLGKGC